MCLKSTSPELLMKNPINDSVLRMMTLSSAFHQVKAAKPMAATMMSFVSVLIMIL